MTHTEPNAQWKGRWWAAITFIVAVLGMTIAGLTVATPGDASAGTSVDGFVSQWNGRHADFDGAYGAQCVDLFNFYNRDVVGAPRVRVDHAADLFGASSASHYQRLSPAATPRKGDVAVWGKDWPYGRGAGHVAIVLADQGGNIQVLTQNPGATKISSMTKNYLTGYLRPRSLAPAPRAHNPVGHIDQVASPKSGTVRVRGWAYDADNSGSSIEVHAYAGGHAGTAGAVGRALRANVARPDVNKAFGIGGNHGFDLTFDPRRYGSIPVCLYAINIGDGGNVLLGCPAVRIADPHPKGVLDEVSVVASNQVRVRGWSFDPDASGTSVKVHIYVGPQPGQPGAKAIAVTANGSRPDVNRAYGISGRHGFDHRVTVSSPRGKKVCAYAINIHRGVTNPAIGCKTA
ncbi:CHAP domain-containing protein [Gordonia sp. NPDC062954]|uniref:CHAP domain-containing protein n=1 Tax=Gordonia sp. NPDC062954 TaxID=3364003 RepID=UPI0037C52DD5